MGGWIGAALLGIVGSSGDTDGAGAADGRNGPTSTGAVETGTGDETPAVGTEIEAAPAIDDEPVFTARSEE